ncbi:LD-carboxypeptidase [Streptomyces sp. NPDC058642]|uniref:LD-carboxypeptidase n=1 Tax=Streptomyces sp. NPDC058642 TaxID=3346572 RepID=UPI003648B809
MNPAVTHPCSSPLSLADAWFSTVRCRSGLIADSRSEKGSRWGGRPEKSRGPAHGTGDTHAITGTARPQLLRPRALRPGDLVVIAALSGPLPTAYEPNVQRTVELFERMGFRVRRAPLLEVGRHHWWSAATPAEIAAELNGLLRDPEVRAIIASDGGQTALGYLDLIAVDAIKTAPKPISHTTNEREHKAFRINNDRVGMCAG